MRVLILGGTMFLSHAIARQALARGHAVTCAARGVSGRVPDGARFVRWDRATDGIPAELVSESFEAVIDVAGLPSRVRSAVDAFAAAHWVFVSTVSVYADVATPGGSPGTLAEVELIDEDVDPLESPQAYGGMKLSCEHLVRDGAASATVVRPGLIVGPEDPTGRFGYWPRRLANAVDGEDVLAPGIPSARVQVIDVRDLAAWIVVLAERRIVGIFDGAAPARPMGEFLAAVAEGVGARPRWNWADDDFLAAHRVAPWTGPRSLPLWLPRPAFDGMLDHDVTASTASGLAIRPLAETARDTAEWLRRTPDAAVTGITRAEEAQLLAALVAR